jgi:ribonucleoside-diphosphate reductase alpha chain
VTESIYEKLSRERKEQQALGKYPEWFTTGSYQMFKESYEYEADGYNDQSRRIARTLAKYAPSFLNESHELYTTVTSNHGHSWEAAFYNIITLGDFAPSTPVLGNTGTNRGCSVSCSGQVVGDSIRDFYEGYAESALLSQQGFGTSVDLSAIRPRGSLIRSGGKATGSKPVLEDFQIMSSKVSQGGLRRGAIGCYLNIMHGDFDEWADNLHKNPEGQNIGWIVNRDTINEWQAGDREIDRRIAKALWVKMITGKGYFWKIDTVNDQQPECYKAHGLTNKASNLCTEIVLHADEDHSYTCIISSMNAYNFDRWKNTGAVFVATVLLDCLASEFLDKAKDIVGLEKAVRYTEKARSLGLGLLGYHSYLQSKMVAFEEYEAHRLNIEIFSHLKEEATKATQWMAKEWGEPEWCKGFGIRNTHLIAIAPNMSSAVLAGQVSQGIEPWLANAFVQPTAAGEMQRINPEFLKLLKRKGKFSKAVIKDVLNKKGSVQHLPWLTDHEKLVFKTAFEMDQRVILRKASIRQRHIDQGQSLNTFFSSEEKEEVILEIHEEFFLDPFLKGLYYIRSESGVMSSTGECVACAS